MSGFSQQRGSFAEAVGLKRKPTLAEQFAWAEKHVPDEVPTFVVSTAIMLAYLRKPVTPDAIRRSLKVQGRAKAQILEDAA